MNICKYQALSWIFKTLLKRITTLQNTHCFQFTHVELDAQ